MRTKAVIVTDDHGNAEIVILTDSIKIAKKVFAKRVELPVYQLNDMYDFNVIPVESVTKKKLREVV